MEISTNFGVTRPEQGSSVTRTPAPAPAVAPAEQEQKLSEQAASAMPTQVVGAPKNEEGGKEEQAPNHETIKRAVNEINKKAQGTEAVFGIHEKTNRVTIKIVDKDTKETIKELPAEKTLDLIAKAWEMAGILVDEKR